MPYSEQQNEAEIMDGIFTFIFNKILKLLWYIPIKNSLKGATIQKFSTLVLFLTDCFEWLAKVTNTNDNG